MKEININVTKILKNYKNIDNKEKNYKQHKKININNIKKC